LGADIGPHIEAEDGIDVLDELYSLDFGTIEALVNPDAEPFYDHGPFGEADITKWLDDCTTSSCFFEYETEGMGTGKVRKYYSEDRKASALFLCRRAEELLKPLHAMRCYRVPLRQVASASTSSDQVRLLSVWPAIWAAG
jgi:hypothetical protein